MIVPFLQATHRHAQGEPYKDNAFENDQAKKQKEPESSDTIQNSHQARLPADLCTANEK